MKSNEKHQHHNRKWIAVVLLHLLLVAGGAFHFTGDFLPIVGRPLAFYGDLSGSGTAYTFFTPGVYAQMRAVIDIVDSSGHNRTQFLGEGPNREVNLRLNDIIEQFMNDYKDQLKFQRSLAASIAGSVFAREHDARKIGISIERYTAPSRREYLAGKTTVPWEKLYSATFVHKTGAEKK